MLSAIYTGLSGMNAHSNGLQTISQNVSNLNTPGFKALEPKFSDLYSDRDGVRTSLGNGTSAQSGGVRFESPTTDFRQGDLRQTGNPLDLAIDGTGFLVLLDGNDRQYVRTGEFKLDIDGKIVLDGTDKQLGLLDAQGQLVATDLSGSRISAPSPTSRVEFVGNLSTSVTDFSLSNIKVFDSNGGLHTWSIEFHAVGSTAPGAWELTVKDAAGTSIHMATLLFLGSAPDPGGDTISVPMPSSSSASASTVILDFSKGVTSFSAGTTSTLATGKIDGFGMGELSTLSIGDAGQLELTYSNGESLEFGHVAIAEIIDPQLLKQVGSGIYEYDQQGGIRLLKSEEGAVGRIVAGQLEASNVNLADEFGELILIQRGFQASSQVVSVANDMIQQLFGIRGQG